MKKETESCYNCKHCCFCEWYECLLKLRQIDRVHTNCCGCFEKRRKGTKMKVFDYSPRLMKEVENFKYKCEECSCCLWDKEEEEWKCGKFPGGPINKDGHACAHFKSKAKKLEIQEQKKKNEEFQCYLQNVVMINLQKAIERVETVKNGIESVDGHKKLKQDVQKALDVLGKLKEKVRIEK